MSTRLEDVLQGREQNYILPFFWQHGEDESVLRHYMHVIHDANIGAVCVEARPHPDFAGEQWWKDMDAIIDEAKKLNMKIWILDDAHFPSGQAAGKVEQAPDELCKQYLNYHMVDIAGPVKQTSLCVAEMAKYYASPFEPEDMFAKMDGRKKREFSDDALMAVIASRLDGKEGDIYHLDDSLLDLTGQVKDGWLYWDVPEGTWRIFVIYATRMGGGRDNYVNFLSKKSCHLQIEAVYEPHFDHYGSEFGKTIAGFFSDEPEIGNISGYGRETGIGNMTMPLPWSEEMPELMEERFGADYLRKIPALWMHVGSDEFTADIRNGYMDIVTDQCRRNFGGQIGGWCRAHGVEYIGHIIEDCGMSTRLGASQGHYFRALDGQDWAGIDDIGGQVVLGGENISHMALLGFDADGEFYHHALGKMGTSLAQIDPKKQGRAMCELFGAYGWGEGTRLMKYITDHFLVRGINRYVPHAFSPKEFPDFDCPPHFYAQGKNPLYQPFGTLMKYTNRIAHLIDGGVHVASVAVLYHAESEWSGMGYTDMVKPARALDDVQIDYDFIPADVFGRREKFLTSVDEQGLHINQSTYQALVIPASDYLAPAVIAFVEEAGKYHFPVYVSGKTPVHRIAGTEVVALDELAETLKLRGICDAVSDIPYRNLQIYHYRTRDEQYYLISNEDTGETYQGNITIPVCGILYRYDAFANELYTVAYETIPQEGGRNAAKTRIKLTLEPYEMAVLVIAEDEKRYKNCARAPYTMGAKVAQMEDGCNVSFVENENYPQFADTVTMQQPENVLRYQPDFSGVIRYEGTVTLSAEKELILSIEDAYESVEVWCNGTYAGERICPPYRFDISGLTHEGTNDIRMEVRTTLERRVHALTGGKSPFGPQFGVVPPSGIIGSVDIKRRVVYGKSI